MMETARAVVVACLVMFRRLRNTVQNILECPTESVLETTTHVVTTFTILCLEPSPVFFHTHDLIILEITSCIPGGIDGVELIDGLLCAACQSADEVIRLGREYRICAHVVTCCAYLPRPL